MGIAYAVGSDSQGKLFRRISILCTEACHEVLTTGATFIALRTKPVKSNALTLHCEPSGEAPEADHTNTSVASCYLVSSLVSVHAQF